MNHTLIIGDVLERLRELPDESVDCVVTSPPYWGLRDYGVDGQIGLEATPQEFIAKMVLVFREIWRVLKPSGTCWINMGDTYSASGAAGNRTGKQGSNVGSHDKPGRRASVVGAKKKCLLAIPWKLAIALDEDGWYLRRDIIWSKPNPMPESAKDRPSTAHEYLFLLAKSGYPTCWRHTDGRWSFTRPVPDYYLDEEGRRRNHWSGFGYYYEAEAIKEPTTGNAHSRGAGANPKAKYKMPDGWDTGPGSHGPIHRQGREKGKLPGKNSRVNVSRNPGGATPQHRQNESFSAAVRGLVDTRNARSVWTIPIHGYKGAHFATFPPELPKRCILAGCPPGGVVLDPFAGSGTTGAVAIELGRVPILIELNPEYAILIEKRLRDAQPTLEVA